MKRSCRTFPDARLAPNAHIFPHCVCVSVCKCKMSAASHHTWNARRPHGNNKSIQHFIKQYHRIHKPLPFYHSYRSCIEGIHSRYTGGDRKCTTHTFQYQQNRNEKKQQMLNQIKQNHKLRFQ